MGSYTSEKDTALDECIDEYETSIAIVYIILNADDIDIFLRYIATKPPVK